MSNDNPQTRTQIRLLIASNTGGSAKTTTAVHIAYGIAAKGFKVVLIEMDPNGSLITFTSAGELEPDATKTLATVLRKDFKGDYPLYPLWAEHLPKKNCYALFGGKALDESISEIETSNRKYQILSDRLEDYPLDADLLILDTPASLKPMALLGLSVATHVLAPIKPEYKDTGSFIGFLDWFYTYVEELRLRPRPELLGFLPCRVDIASSTHQSILGIDRQGKLRTDIDGSKTLPGAAHSQGIHCFPFIRESQHFLTASGLGLPLQAYRPKADAAKDYDPIVTHLVKLIKSK